MRKLFLFICIALLFAGCSKPCEYLKEEKKSWGMEYNWAYINNSGKMVFYTLMQGDYGLGNTFYEKGPFDEDRKHSYVKEYENAEIGVIERQNGEIKAITVNGKKYTFSY